MGNGCLSHRSAKGPSAKSNFVKTKNLDEFLYIGCKRHDFCWCRTCRQSKSCVIKCDDDEVTCQRIQKCGVPRVQHTTKPVAKNERRSFPNRAIGNFSSVYFSKLCLRGYCFLTYFHLYMLGLYEIFHMD